MKIAFLGDRHICSRSPRYRHALECWNFAIDHAIKAGVDAFVGLGDVCEGDPNGEERYELGQRYRRMVEHAPTYEISGNHESREALRWLEFLGVRVAWDHFLSTTIGDSVDLLLVPYARKGHPPFNDLGEGLSIEASNRAAAEVIEKYVRIYTEIAWNSQHPLIVAGHWTVEGTRTGESDYEIHSSSEMVVPRSALAGSRLVVTGHIHKAQEIIDDGVVVVVAGSLYRCSFTEEVDEKSFIIVSAENGHVGWERVPVPCRTMHVMEFTWGADSVDKYLSTAPADLSSTEIKLTVRIPQDQAATFDASVFEPIRQRAAYFVLEKEIIPTTRTRAPEVSRANTVPEQLAAWFRATDQEVAIEAERMTRIEQKLTEMLDG